MVFDIAFITTAKICGPYVQDTQQYGNQNAATVAGHQLLWIGGSEREGFISLTMHFDYDCSMELSGYGA